MNQMFREKCIQEEFEANGFVKLPWLNDSEVRQLRALYSQLTTDTPDGFFTSYALPDRELKAGVRLGILSVFEPRLRATFVDAQALLCSFITKTRGDGKAEYISAHQDWTFVDETHGDVSINIWCPLEETNDHNGNLFMVPGSNRLPRYLRQAEPCDTPYKAYYDALKQVAVAVPTTLGEAVLFDNAVIHFSSRNQTDSLRLVAGTMAIPHQSKPVLYYQNLDDARMLDEYLSGIDYFIQKPFGARPDTFLRHVLKPSVSDVEGEIRKLYPSIRMGPANTVESPPALGPPAETTPFLRRLLRRLFG